MASRFSAARPKRDGENFARTHHHDQDGESASKKVKFDVRNPSTLAPDAREDDAILDADVIGGSAATKRGAVNLDGYDSDSDNETFNAKAASRKERNVNILEQLDNYDAQESGANGKGSDKPKDGAEDDDDDMFAVDEDGVPEEAGDRDFDNTGRKRKDVRFMDAAEIEGQDDTSKGGGRVTLDEHDTGFNDLDERESSDDEADVELAIQEEGLDKEVGAGGLKRNAPQIEAFNLKAELDQGRFDQDGNYVRKAEDPDAVHDKWLEGVSKKEMKRAAEAHEKRENEARQQRLQEDGVLVSDLLKALILQLEKAETPLEALARLGKKQTKPKKVPKWKLNKMNKGNGGMELDAEAAQDPVQAQIKESINAITEAADKLLSRDYEEIYDQERELLVREYRRQAGEDWVEPVVDADGESGDRPSDGAKSWEFRWTDGRDGGATQGPFDGAAMKAWEEAGYFGQGVEFRLVGDGDNWTQTASFV
ncbi:hypothetical protein HIM_00237 [Hirsutella minnesotensis 3608]|nr:hypothetical protein HIM_00237 [Hirsutella minnesotensis 3608]